MNHPANHSLSPKADAHSVRGGFSLVELLLVITVMVILLAVLVPAITSTAPTDAAMSELQSTLELARSEAIRSNTDVFVAFSDSLPDLPGGYPDSSRYRVYGIFKRVDPPQDIANPLARYRFDHISCQLETVRPWAELPDGLRFALGEDIESDFGSLKTLIDSTDPEDTIGSKGSARRRFPLPIGSKMYSAELPCIIFNAEGRVRHPDWNETDYLYLGIMMADYIGGKRVPTQLMSGGSKPRPVVDLLRINPYTGRVRQVDLGIVDESSGGRGTTDSTAE